MYTTWINLFCMLICYCLVKGDFITIWYLCYKFISRLCFQSICVVCVIRCTPHMPPFHTLVTLFILGKLRLCFLSTGKARHHVLNPCCEYDLIICMQWNSKIYHVSYLMRICNYSVTIIGVVWFNFSSPLHQTYHQL